MENEVNTPSDKSNSSKKKYTPTLKLSERKRALFRISNEIQKPIAEEEEPLSPDLHSDNSLDGLEFCDNDNKKLPAKSNLLKSSSFLSHIEDINNDDFLLSADSSNDFEISIQKSIEIEFPTESEKSLNFHDFMVSVKTSDKNFIPSPKSILTKDSSNFVKHLSNSSIDSNTIIPETPPKKNTPRTPYETLNTDLQLPRMNNRKSLLSIFKTYGENHSNIENLNDKYINDSNNENKTVQNLLNSELKPHGLKRSLETSTPDLIPSKMMKLDDKKSPKARTSLFSNSDENKSELEDSGVSPKLFYRPSLSPIKKTNSNEMKSDSKILLRSCNHKNGTRKKGIYLCGRSKKRNSFGEINAGVRTGIKKPKLKNKITQSTKKHLFKEEALKLLREKQENSQTPSKSIWNKKIVSKFSTSGSTLPLDKINEMDKLIQENKQPTVIQNTKRSFEISSDAVPLTQESKRAKLDEKLIENKENIEGKPRKFFKSRTNFFENRTVKLVNNITLKYENGKMKMQAKPLRKIHTSRPYTFDASDLTVDADIKLNNVEEVIKHLDEIPITSIETNLEDNKSTQIQSENENKLILSAHYSCLKDDNSIILHQPPTEIEMKDVAPQNPLISKLNDTENIIMSPTSLMCDMTSGLALTSPKKHLNITKAANLTDKLSNCPTKDEVQKSQAKVYPIFVKGHQSTPAQTLTYAMNRKNFSTRNRRVWKTLDDRQYQIDAGQKRWGVTQCPTCEVVYSQNEPEDEQRHLDFHNKVQYLRFNGWKNEKIVGYFNFNRGRIIEIGQNDSKAWWKRITDLLFVIDQDLGYSNLQVINPNASKVYLYIENKQIHGFLSAVPIKQAYRMIPTENLDCCSQTPLPVKCGVSRIWVASSYRRKKIATNLMDTLRKSFVVGYHLTINDLAFSTPSTSGKLFIQSYTKTNEYLIFTE